MHEKKTKGDIGVAFTIASATEQNWNVSLPITEHAPYDLIIEKDGNLKRVQVRYTKPDKNNRLNVKLRSSWADKHGSHSKNRQQGDYDLLAVYNPVNKKVYFVPDNIFPNASSITLRVDPEDKSNTCNVIWFADSFDRIV